MHETALIAGRAFAAFLASTSPLGTQHMVLDIGGQDVNGSLRSDFEKLGMKFICVDMISHPSVDIVCAPGERMPFEDGSVDAVVTTSCFEHDPCFWMTFREMCRIVKPDGFIYVNAPSGGQYHGFPGDNWRFYGDAGQALAFWASKRLYDTEPLFPVKVLESFHTHGHWQDFVCLWQRTSETTDSISRSHTVMNSTGPLEESIASMGLIIIKQK